VAALEQFTDALQSPFITKGLAQFGADYYAVLGIAMDAPIIEIRKNYRNIVRLLHPDRFGRDTEGKAEAEQILARLVNPAFEILSNEGQRRDYDRLIRVWAGRMREYQPLTYRQLLLMQQMLKLTELQTFYRQAIFNESVSIYKDKNDLVALGVANELSIYNLGYVLGCERLNVESEVVAPPPSVVPPPVMPSSESRSGGVNFAASHFERGKMLLDRRLYREAVQSLKEATRLAPENASYHANLGLAYMRQGLPGMAKAEFTQALALDPNDALARKEITRINNTGSPAPQPKTPTNPKSETPSEPGLQGTIQKLWKNLNKPL